MNDTNLINIELNQLTRTPLNKPYTESLVEYNIKPHEVFCPSCKYTITTSLVNPKCGDCNRNLITIVPKLVTDEIMAR